MKKLLTILATLVVGVGVFAGAQGVQAAANFESSEDSVGVSKLKSIGGAWYGAGDTVNVDGKVDGSVYCGAKKVVITGEVKGDVICGAKQITIAEGAKIEGDVRLAAQDVFINSGAEVTGDATVFADSFNLNSGAKIARDLNGAAANILINGTVGRDVAIGADRFNLNGEIGRDVDTAVNSVKFGDKAKIVGSLSYTSSEKQEIPESVVSGGITWHESEANQVKKYDTQAAVLGAVMSLVFAFVIALIFPRFLTSSSEAADKKFGLTVGVGALSLLVVVISLPVISLLLMVTVLGLYAGLALLLLWGLWFLLLFPTFAYYIGRLVMRVYNKGSNVFLNMLAGTLILLALMQIPFLRGLTIFATIVIGGGVLSLWIYRNFKKPVYVVSEAKSVKRSTVKK